MRKSPKAPWFASLDEVRARGAIAGFGEETPHRFLSNFTGPVEMYGIAFPAVEYAFVAAKLAPPQNHAARDAWKSEINSIIALPHPSQARSAGRRLKLRPDWHARNDEGLELREWVLLNLIRRKFAAPAFGEKLLASEKAMLIEFIRTDLPAPGCAKIKSNHVVVTFVPV